MRTTIEKTIPINPASKQDPVVDSVRTATEIEERTNRVAKLLKQPPTQAEGIMHKMEHLSLRDSLAALEQVEVLLKYEHERILGPYLQNMGVRSSERNEELSEEIKSRKVSIPFVLGGAATLVGAILGALTATGTFPTRLATLIPAAVQNGQIITAAGGFTTAIGNVNEKLSQADQTRLKHLYELAEERKREIDRIKNLYGQEKTQALNKLQEIENSYVRFVQDLLNR